MPVNENTIRKMMAWIELNFWHQTLSALLGDGGELPSRFELTKTLINQQLFTDQQAYDLQNLIAQRRGNYDFPSTVGAANALFDTPRND